jgi:hypothetical protein
VGFGPLANEAVGARWQLSVQRFERCDHDLCLVLAIDGVEVRGLVIAP